MQRSRPDIEHRDKAAKLRGQRGVTMVSVLLLTVALLTLGLLAVRSSVREVSQAGQLVARERALMVAQAAADLAAARYMRMEPDEVDNALTGYNAQGTSCINPCGDCIPNAADVATGQRNDVLAGGPVGCGGRPCMRQGAVAFLEDANQTEINWCDIPFRDVLVDGDPEARVSVWLRNNSADALGASGSGSWIDDNDGRVVISAMATVRGTTVAIEREVMLGMGLGPMQLVPGLADEGYGGGHNNDNSAVAICTEDFVEGTAVP